MTGSDTTNSEYTDFYQRLGCDVGRLVDQKQLAYGDSFGRVHRILEVLWPDGVSKASYRNLLCVVRILDKLFRVASHNGADPMGESPGRDIAGYGILMAAMHEGK